MSPRPSGLPIAMTVSPSCSLDESPIFATVLMPSAFTVSTARSLTLSAPTRSALRVSPSTMTISSLLAPEMTWLLVII
ncbi:hypothetical protein D3C72_2121980 [compost metagenome]